AWDRAVQRGAGTALADKSLCFWRLLRQLRTRLCAAKDYRRAWCRSSVCRPSDCCRGRRLPHYVVRRRKCFHRGTILATKVQARRCLMSGEEQARCPRTSVLCDCASPVAILCLWLCAERSHVGLWTVRL